MSDLTQTGVATSDESQSAQKASDLIPFFNADDADGPTVFSASDMNKLVRLLRAYQRVQVTIDDADQNSDGSYTNSGTISISDTNVLLALLLVPGNAPSSGGGSSVTAMQVSSYTTTNEYLSAVAGSYLTDDTFTPDGSAAVNVALPWDLRQSRIPESLAIVWPPYTAGDIIEVLTTPSGKNGVFVSAVELTLIDINAGGKAWARKVSYKDGTCIEKYRFVVCSDERT